MSLALVVVLGLLIGVALGALGGGGSILAVPMLAHARAVPAGRAAGGPDRPRGDRRVVEFE